jgi:hypothetical protein
MANSPSGSTSGQSGTSRAKARLQYFLDQRLAGTDEAHPLPTDYHQLIMAEYRRRQQYAAQQASGQGTGSA